MGLRDEHGEDALPGRRKWERPTLENLDARSAEKVTGHADGNNTKS